MHQVDRANEQVANTQKYQGLVFNNAYATAMLTTPSHCSIMTSLYPRTHGVYDNRSGIDHKTQSLAEILNKKEYDTAAVIGFPQLNPNVANLGQGFNHIVKAMGYNRPAKKTTVLALEQYKSLNQNKPRFL